MTSWSVLHHSSATISAVIPIFFHLLADNAERVDLSRFLSHIHRAFDAQVKRFCYFCQLAHITGNGFEIVIEDNTQCSVNVYVDNRIVAVERLQLQDSLPEPLDIRFDFFLPSGPLWSLRG